jgi:hypothetical protein
MTTMYANHVIANYPYKHPVLLLNLVYYNNGIMLIIIFGDGLKDMK